MGGTVEIFNRTFELFEADEYTYTYMENNKHVFIMADHEVLLKSLRAQVGGGERRREGWGVWLPGALKGLWPENGGDSEVCSAPLEGHWEC